MTNSNSWNVRRVTTLLLATLLLSSAALAQTLLSSAQAQDRLSDFPNKVAASRIAVAPALDIKLIAWNVIGLDSNNVNVGPNLFPVGARVCNNGADPAINVVSSIVWDSANALINLRTGSLPSLSKSTLAVGACTDFYYEVEVKRDAAAYNTFRRFHITAAADGVAPISTPTPREVFIEKIISQNRNSVTAIKLNGATIGFGGIMNLVVGNTYTIRLEASTATNGYEQIESFINLPNIIFQTLSVSSTYTAPSGYIGDKLYEDACGWDPVPTNLATYRSCVGPANPAGNKAGGNVALTYIVKVLSTGGPGNSTDTTLNTLIHDFSGSSYHYNNDFSTTFVIARVFEAPTAAHVSLQGRAMLQAGNGIRNVGITLTEQDGTQHYTTTSSFGYYRFDDLPAGQTVVVSAAAKRYTFSQPNRIVSLQDNLTEFNFIANE